MTQDEFAETYLCGFYIFGIHVDDIESLYDTYREMILKCNSLDSADMVKREFKFLSAPTYIRFCDLYSSIDELHKDIQSDMLHLLNHNQPKMNACIPNIMVKAKIIANDFEVPEYIAAFQYVMSQFKE